MAQPQRYEGTWEEVNAQLAAHAAELRNYKRLRLIIEPDENEPEINTHELTPNAKALAVLQEIFRRQAGKRRSDGSQTDQIIREGRGGAMYNRDAAE